MNYPGGKTGDFPLRPIHPRKLKHFFLSPASFFGLLNLYFQAVPGFD